MTMKKIDYVTRHTDLSSPEAMEYIRKGGIVSGVKTRRYSLAQMDEAVRIAAERGLAAAVEITGVGLWSIKKHATALKRRNKTPAEIAKEYRGQKHNYEKLAKVVERARKMQAAGIGTFWSCIRRACQIEQISYNTVRSLINKGTLK